MPSSGPAKAPPTGSASAEQQTAATCARHNRSTRPARSGLPENLVGGSLPSDLSNTNRFLGRYEIPTSTRTDVGQAEHTLADVVFREDRVLVLGSDGIGEMSAGRWRRVLELGSTDMPLRSATRMGDTLDVWAGASGNREPA